MSLGGLFRLDHRASVSTQPSAGVGGGEILMGRLLRGRQAKSFGFGVGAGRFNRAYYYNSRDTGNAGLLTTVARALDLQTTTDQYGVAIGLEEVNYFEFIADPDNTYNITMTPNAANGWDGLIAATGDLVKVKPGMRLVVDAMRLDVGLVVDATHKVLDIANATSSTQHYEMLIVGRSTV